MTTPLGLNGSTVPRADLLTGIQAAAAAGFSRYEPRVPVLTASAGRAEVDAALRLLSDSALSWLPLNALENVFSMDEKELERAAGQVISLAAKFHVPKVIVVPGRRTGQPLAVDQAASQLEQLKDQAAEDGITLLYELIGFAAHHFPSLNEAHEVARAAGLPLVLDTFHLAVSRTEPAQVAALPAGAIGHVHLSDALTADRTPETLTDADRVLPGEGGLDLAALMSGVRATGYTGPVSVEVFHTKYGEKDPGAVAHDAYARAVAVLKQAGF